MAKKAPAQIEVPSAHNWRTTDEDEINRRRLRARTEQFRITNVDARHPIFSNFRVQSGSGLNYSVEVRHPGHSAEDSARLSALVDHCGLVPSGGSDWHGLNEGGRALGAMRVPMAWLARQDERVAQRLAGRDDDHIYVA